MRWKGRKRKKKRQSGGKSLLFRNAAVSMKKRDLLLAYYDLSQSMEELEKKEGGRA